MNNTFIIEEFSEYKVFLYDQKAHHPDVDEAIVIPFSEGVVHFMFFSKGIHENKIMGSSTRGSRYFIYISSDKFSRFIDILRHEKPLYLALNKEELWAYLTTELEPVGEGNIDLS